MPFVGYSLVSARQSGWASVRAAYAVSDATSTEPKPSASKSTSARSKTLSLAEVETAVDPAFADITSAIGTSGTDEGTGMVISSTGEILTNNQVLSGATSIAVQIAGTGRTYQATLVGYDVTADIAVLHIANVSRLETITTANSATVSIGNAVNAIGNALGEGGAPAAVPGALPTSTRQSRHPTTPARAQKRCTG